MESHTISEAQKSINPAVKSFLLFMIKEVKFIEDLICVSTS